MRDNPTEAGQGWRLIDWGAGSADSEHAVASDVLAYGPHTCSPTAHTSARLRPTEVLVVQPTEMLAVQPTDGLPKHGQGRLTSFRL